MVVLIISISSAVALADSDTSSDPARVFPVGLYDDKTFDSLASGTKALHDVNDVYLLLYDDIRPALIGASYSNTFSLPRIANDIRGFYDDFVDGMGPNGYGFFEQASDSYQIIQDQIPLIYSTLSQVHGDGQNNSYYLSQISSKLSLSLDWVNCNATSYPARESVSGSDVSSGWYTHLFFRFIVPSSSASSSPSFFRVFIPFSPSGTFVDTPDISLNSVKIWNNNSLISTLGTSDYFANVAPNGIYLYLPDFHITYNSGTYFFEITVPSTFYYNSSYPITVYSLPFDSYDYQILASAFYQRLSSLSLGSLDKLADVYASDDLIQAKQAQQSVEDSVLDDFTGSGSESMSLNDVGGVKQVSGQAKSFLGSGSSSSNALSLFNVNGQGLWQWFSQTTSDNLDTTSNNRKSSYDYYFYDTNMNDYYNGLGGSDAR